MLQVMLVWHGAAGGAYPRRLEALVKAGCELSVVVPSPWRENGLTVRTEPEQRAGYRVLPQPALFAWHGSLYVYRSFLGGLFHTIRPDVVHIHEEPFSLSTAQMALASRRYRPRAAIVVESWQNLYKRFPPPFSWSERWTVRHADYLIAGSEEIRAVLERKGACAPVSVVPLATDMSDFRRTESAHVRERLAGGADFLIGYVGRLVPEKGVGLLLEAAAGLAGSWALALVGTGPELPRLEEQARSLDVHQRTRFVGGVPHHELPAYLSAMDVLVLPSLTTPRWKEQFGRVLIEAMACEVPVIGSSSGEIPHVIGDAGMIFPEGDAPALRACLERLAADPHMRRSLGRRGYERVARHYTWQKVAGQTVEVYRDAIRRRRIREARR